MSVQAEKSIDDFAKQLLDSKVLDSLDRVEIIIAEDNQDHSQIGIDELIKAIQSSNDVSKKSFEISSGEISVDINVLKFKRSNMKVNYLLKKYRLWTILITLLALTVADLKLGIISDSNILREILKMFT